MVKEAVTMSEVDRALYEAVVDAIEDIISVRESQSPLKVSVQDGVVTISGVTFTEPMRRRVLVTVARIEGVQHVVDQLWDDNDFEIAVSAALGGIPELWTGRSLQVHSYNGFVSLHGTVPSEDLKARAVELATAIPGIQGVNTDALLVED